LNFPERSYPGKVLLFGEHTVVLGGNALAIPFDKYQCSWSPYSDKLEFWWQSFIDYLIKECLEFLPVDLLRSIYNYTPLVWNIPVGYGLGSSGAITAAIYDYCVGKSDISLPKLQSRLGLMESFFHGESSGYDPLISFQATGIYKSESQMRPWAFDIETGLHYYLLDSGSPRSGKDLIQQFRIRASENPRIHSDITELNNHIISAIVEKGVVNFNDIKDLSALQYEHMDYMIVDSVKSVWEKNLSNPEIAIKICGAGGGGYYLVIADRQLEHLGSFVLEEIKQ